MTLLLIAAAARTTARRPFKIIKIQKAAKNALPEEFPIIGNLFRASV